MQTTMGNSRNQPGDAAGALRCRSYANWLTRLGGRVVTAIAAAGLLLAGAAIPAASQEAGLGASGASGKGTSAPQKPKGSAKPDTKPGTKSETPPAAGTAGNEAAAPRGEVPDMPPASPSIPSLDEMLIAALAENPDIRVAEANLHAAEAELSRSRLSVVRKVMEFRQKWEAQRILVEQLEAKVEVATRLSATAPLQNPRAKQLADFDVIQGRAKLAEIEAELPYLVGQKYLTASRPGGGMGNESSALGMGGRGIGAAGGGPMGGGGRMIGHQLGMPMGMDLGMGGPQVGVGMGRGGGGVAPSTTKSGGVAGDGMAGGSLGGSGGAGGGLGGTGAGPVGGMSGSGGTSKSPPPKATAKSLPAGLMTEKLRKALKSKMEVKFDNTPLLDILNQIRDTNDVRFIIHPQSKKDLEGLRVTLDLGEVPTGLFLEALSDTLYITFEERDYGVLVGMSGTVIYRGGGPGGFAPGGVSGRDGGFGGGGSVGSLRELWRSDLPTEGLGADPHSVPSKK